MQNLMQSAIQGFLKQYISNFEKTEFSLWGGTLDLTNIVLNDEAIDNLCGLSGWNLKLNCSFIDKVKISVPIRDFLSKPMQIKA